MGLQAYEFNPPSQIDSLSETGCLTLRWDCNYSWSKIYNWHWFCSMKCLQETSTDLLTRLKINWTVFRVFFGMKSESSRSPSQMNSLLCFGFCHWIIRLFQTESFIHGFFFKPSGCQFLLFPTWVGSAVLKIIQRIQHFIISHVQGTRRKVTAPALSCHNSASRITAALPRCALVSLKKRES